MNIHDTRRANLARWLEKHSVPPGEKSLFSQLKNPDRPFGEKVARRIEADYGMGDGYLDRSPESVDNDASIADEISEIVLLFGKSDRDGRNAILDAARGAAMVAAAVKRAKNQ